jgi:hypothetical protein
LSDQANIPGILYSVTVITHKKIKFFIYRVQPFLYARNIEIEFEIIVILRRLPRIHGYVVIRVSVAIKLIPTDPDDFLNH